MKEEMKQDDGNCGKNPHRDSKAMIRIGICQLIVTSASFFAQLLTIGK